MSDACPRCGAPEVPSTSPRTLYACESSDYAQLPSTFRTGRWCRSRWDTPLAFILLLILLFGLWALVSVM